MINIVTMKLKINRDPIIRRRGSRCQMLRRMCYINPWQIQPSCAHDVTAFLKRYDMKETERKGGGREGEMYYFEGFAHIWK